MNIKINEQKKVIEVIGKAFSKKASVYGTEEYKMLQDARKDYPTFRVITITNAKKKVCYKGLTYEYMEMYIEKHDDENKSKMLAYKNLRALDEESEIAFAEACSYQEIKEWFLNEFTEIAEFHKKRESILANKKSA
ncbi:MAG: hypothetical protein E7391_00730 [Ruminococcaceae bacterium]|nr:hypothetical protein [Oscillospiraceae bacterium]